MRRLARGLSSFIAFLMVGTIVSVVPVGANGAPSSAGIDDIYGIDVASPAVVDLTTAFADPDADELTFSLVANTDATFVTTAIDNTLDRLTVTRTAGAVGSAIVTIQASDGSSATQTSFRVTDADHVWTGLGSNNNWNNGDNWVPRGIPWSEDVALMDSGSKDVLVTTSSLTVTGLRATDGYDGTIDLNGRNVAAFADFDLAGASLDAAGAIVTVHGDLDLRNAAVDASNAMLKVKGDLDLGGAALVATGSNIELLGTRPVNVSGPGTPIGNLTIDTAQSITLDADITVGGLLTLKSLVSLNGAALRAAGHVVAKDLAYDGSSMLEVVGAGSQTIAATTTNAALVNTRIDKPSGTATFVGIFGVRGSFVHNNGAVDLTGTQIRFSAGMTQISAPALVFDDVELGSNFSSPVIGDLEIDGDLTIGSVAGAGASGTGFLNVRGDVTSTDAVVASTVGIRFVGSGNQTISAADTDLTDGDLIIDKPTGSVTLAAGLSVQGTAQRLRIISGVFDANGKTLSVGNGVVVDGGTLTGATSIDRQETGVALSVTSGTVQLTPAEVASVAIGGDLVVDADDTILEVDLTNTGVGNHPNLLLATDARSGEFSEVTATNNPAGYLVTPLYGTNSVGIGLALPNDAPTIADGLPDRFGLTSGLALSLVGAFEDPDGDDLSFSLVANSAPDFVSASVSGSQLLLAPVAGEVGSSQIAVRATDPAGEWVEASFRATDADHVWTGAAATEDWDTPQNWLPQEVPGPTDVVVIDSGSGNIRIGNGSTVQSLRIEPGFGGTVSVGAATNLTVVGPLRHRGGTIDITGASLTVGGESQFRSNAVLTANSRLVVRTGASLELEGIEWNDVELQRQGLLDSISTDADLLIGGDLTAIGVVNVVGSSLRLVGTDDQSISAGAGFLGTDGRPLVIEKASGTVSLGTPLDVHDLTLASGALDLQGNTLRASGNLDLSGGSVTADGSTIELIDDGSARTVTFHGPSAAIDDLRINSANIVTLAVDVEVGGLLTLAAVERLDGSMLRARGDVHTSDVDYRGTSTLAFVGTVDQRVTAESSQSSLRNVRIEKPSGAVGFEDSLQVQGGFVHVGGGVAFAGASTVDQTIMFTGSSHAIGADGVTFDNVTFGGGFAGSITGGLRVGGEFSIGEMTGPTTAGPGGEIIALGNLTSNDAVVDSLVPIRLAGSADQIVSGGDLTDADLIIDKPAGTVSLNDGLNLDGPGQAIVVAAGTLDTGGNTIDVDGGVWIDAGELQGGGSIRGQSGLTLSGGGLSIDPDDPTTYFAVDGPIVLGGALRLDLSGVSAGSYMDLITSGIARVGTFATMEVSNNGDGLVVNERYGTDRAGVALGNPIVGQPDDLSIELPATATSVDLATVFGRTDLGFVVTSDQSFVTASIDPATPGVLDLSFETATIGTAEITVEVSSADSGTETVRFDVTLIDSTNPQISVAEPLADATFAHDAPISVVFGCDDRDGTVIVSCAGSVDGVPISSGATARTFAPGDHVLIITSTDAAGNTASSTRSFTVLARLTAEVATLERELPAASMTIDLANAFGESGLTYEATSDRPFVSPTVNGEVLQLVFSPGITGSATVTIGANSPSGAKGSATFAVNLTDTAAPGIAVTSPTDNAAFAHLDPVPIAYSCAVGEGTPIARCTAKVEGAVTGDFSVTPGTPLESLSPGSYQLAVTAADTAGNEQTLRRPFSVLGELTASIEPLTLRLPAESVSIDLAEAFGRSGLSFTASSNQTFVDAEMVGNRLDLDFTPGATGSAAVVVSATSTEGARGSVIIAIALVDDDDPAIEIESPRSTAYAFGTSIGIRFACDDRGGTPIVSCLGEIDGGTMAIGSATSKLGTGRHELVVQAVDAAGNRTRVVVPFEVAKPLRQSPLIGTEFERTSGISGTVSRLYVAVFNRAPDPAGHAYWQSRVDGGMSLIELTVMLVRSPEYQSIYDTPDNADFVEHVYQNVLRRSADPAGKAYWIGQLGGDFDRAYLVLLVAESTESRQFSNTN